jgi:hypothetical protein
MIPTIKPSTLASLGVQMRISARTSDTMPASTGHTIHLIISHAHSRRDSGSQSVPIFTHCFLTLCQYSPHSQSGW